MVVAHLPFDRAKALGKDLASRIAEDGINHDVFHDWVGDDADRDSFLARSVWGMIRWDKALGRPDGATLASGFAVTHKAYWVSLVATANGVHETQTWIAHDDVVLYDLPDDGDTHRVGFSCRDDDHPPYTGDNLVTAALHQITGGSRNPFRSTTCHFTCGSSHGGGDGRRGTLQ